MPRPRDLSAGKKRLLLRIIDQSDWCRLACHSCAPNTEVVAWKVEGLDCLAMYSIKDIKANESVTFDQSPQNQVFVFNLKLISPLHQHFPQLPNLSTRVSSANS